MADPTETFHQFLGDQVEYEYAPAAAHLAQHLSVATRFVHAFTLGRGFDDDGVPNEELAAVILTAASRLGVNPEQRVSETEQRGDHDSTAVRFTPFTGFTLAEQAVLNRYRRRAS